jgi:UDP-N-acetyl-D-mannosaminuronic acid dehydrogenase
VTEASPKVAIIGLGYVGLTLAVALARRSVMVYGIEKRAEVVALTNAGEPHFSEAGLDTALQSVITGGTFVASETTDAIPPCECYISTGGTPLQAGTHQPRLDMIEQASRQVAEHMPDGAAVILRSTVKIGTTRGIVKPVLDAAGKAYHLSMSPERTLEGDALRELVTLPQIIGGMSERAADLAASLFSRLTHTIVRVTDPETAEMIKLVDNTSRDVRFAFANEVARACDAIGVNANDVIRFGKLAYSRTDVALPGLVGGPCLEKDPHILMASVAPFDCALEITAASRQVNERQPQETVSAILAKLRQRRSGPFTAVVAGIAYTGGPATDDLRGSMSLHIIDRLAASGECKEIRVFDEVVRNEQLAALEHGVVPFDTLAQACEGADVLIIANNHPAFGAIDPESLIGTMADGAFVYDYWNNLGQLPTEVLRERYFTVGNLVGKY